MTYESFSTSGALTAKGSISGSRIDIIYMDKDQKDSPNKKNHGHLVTINRKEVFNRPTPRGLTASQEEDSLVLKKNENILWRIYHRFFNKK